MLGIRLIKADDFEMWLLSLEVLGESLYKVRLSVLSHTALDVSVVSALPFVVIPLLSCMHVYNVSFFHRENPSS